MTIDKRKIWCFFGVHEYRVIHARPFEQRLEGVTIGFGCYCALSCSVCGKIKRRVLV